MRKFRRSHWRQIAVAVVIASLAAYRLWNDSQTGDLARPPESAGDLAAGVHQVQRIVDGDTLLLRPHVRLRLQGVDAPESVTPDRPVEPWGPEASAFTKQFVESAGGKVSVEIDGEPHDQYGRSLGFVWADGRMLNEELLRAGLAEARLGYTYSQAKKDRLRRAQQQAQREGAGIWSTR
jgi:micrococcal nuclease